jgi:hypothetical protein
MTKSQSPNNDQSPSTNHQTQNLVIPCGFGDSVSGDENVFGYWNLVFGELKQGFSKAPGIRRGTHHALSGE